MSQISNLPRLATTYNCLDVNLAAAFGVNRCNFHPSYPDGQGQINVTSNLHGSSKGWFFEAESAEGIPLKTLQNGWEEPTEALSELAGAIMAIPGPEGERLQKAYAPAMMGLCHLYHWSRQRFVARSNGDRVPWIQIDKGGTRALFKKDDHNAAKWLKTR